MNPSVTPRPLTRRVTWLNAARVRDREIVPSCLIDVGLRSGFGRVEHACSGLGSPSLLRRTASPQRQMAINHVHSPRCSTRRSVCCWHASHYYLSLCGDGHLSNQWVAGVPRIRVPCAHSPGIAVRPAVVSPPWLFCVLRSRY